MYNFTKTRLFEQCLDEMWKFAFFAIDKGIDCRLLCFVNKQIIFMYLVHCEFGPWVTMHANYVSIPHIGHWLRTLSCNPAVFFFFITEITIKKSQGYQRPWPKNSSMWLKIHDSCGTNIPLRRKQSFVLFKNWWLYAWVNLIFL